MVLLFLVSSLVGMTLLLLLRVLAVTAVALLKQLFLRFNDDISRAFLVVVVIVL